MIPERRLPFREQFIGSLGFILVSGNPANVGALAPVVALHTLYAQRGNEINATAAEIKAEQIAAAAWEAAHPTPPQDEVIKVWSYQNDEYPTATQPSPTAPTK